MGDLRIDHTYDLANAIPRYSLEIPPPLAHALAHDLEQLAPLLRLPDECKLLKWSPRHIAGWMLDNTKPGWLIQAVSPRYKADDTPTWNKPHRRWFYTQTYAQGIIRARKWADEMTQHKERMSA